MSEKIFVVTAYRWGLRDAHSYVVGAFPALSIAEGVAKKHLDDRCGKYGMEIVECVGVPDDDGGFNFPKQARYFECPFFGSAGRSWPACHPADNTKMFMPKGKEASDERE